MAAEAKRLDALLGAVSDGETVDWREALATAEADDVALVRSLALVAQIAQAHRATLDSENSPTIGPAAAEPFTGPRQIAHYRVIRELGAGGMGTVFEAHDERMNRRVALKVLSRHHAPSERSEERFEREAWIAGRLDHPAIVKVYDRGTWEELSYYSMELVQGGSLHDVVSNMRRWGRDDRLRLAFGSADYVTWAVRTVIDAARGLDHAHRQGVVHRDVKPLNLLISAETGAVKIADFGLAVDLDTTRLTTAGKMLGTLAYMAPEQILGKREAIVPATDVYALGVTLFELLTLEFPYAGATQQLYMNAVLTTESRRPSKLNERVGRDLEIVIRKTLEKVARERYASAGDFADDLENVLRLRPIRARPTAWPERVIKWARRRPVHAALAGTLLVAGPVVAVLTQRAMQHARLEGRLAMDALEKQVSWLAMRGRDDDAMEKVTALLERDPDRLLARRSRAVLLMRAAEAAASHAQVAELQERALAEMSEIVDRAPDLSWPHALRAIMLRRFGREAAALREEDLAGAARSGAAGEDDLLFDALLARDAGRLEEAVELLSELIARKPGSPEALVVRGSALGDLGRLDAAIEDFRVATALSPEDAYWAYQLGDLYMRRGRSADAATEFGRATELAPGDGLLHQDLAHSLLDWGRASVSAGDEDQARRHFEHAERAARRSLEIDPALAMAHINLGASLMEQNRLLATPAGERSAEAIRHYEAALASTEGATDARSARAHAYALANTCDALTQLGELERALPLCRRVAERAPADPVSFYNLAGVYALLGHRDEAFAALEQDLRLGDTDWEYLASDRWFEGLHEDPRFAELIARMKQSRSKTVGGDP